MWLVFGVGIESYGAYYFVNASTYFSGYPAFGTFVFLVTSAVMLYSLLLGYGNWVGASWAYTLDTLGGGLSISYFFRDYVQNFFGPELGRDSGYSGD
jgi:hypothetical protein